MGRALTTACTGLAPDTLAGLVHQLHRAEGTATPLLPFARTAGYTLADAYAIQAAWVAHKLSEGAQRIGHKVGFTSRAVQRLLQIEQPGFGVLLDRMLLDNGRDVPLQRFIQPRVEVELLFVMKQRLAGPNPTLSQALLAIDHVVPALEIIDGRVGPAPSAADIVADNAGNAALVLGGSPVRPEALDLCRVAALLYRNGAIEDSGVSAAVMGHPLLGVLALVRALHAQGQALEAGEMVLAGAFIAPLPIHRGDTVQADYGSLGSVALRFV